MRRGQNCPLVGEKIMWKKWRKREKEKIEIVEDEQLLQEISPAGDLLHYESYSRTGTGYEACVHIYDYPEVLDDYWLTNPCNQENTIVTISIHNEDQNEVKKNLNRSIEEQGSRKKFAKEYKDFYDAAARESEMKALYDEINSMGEVIKAVAIRIFAAESTKQKLENSVAKVIKSLEGDNYRATVFLNETRKEWKSVYQSAEEQMKETHTLPGFAMKSQLIAAGNPFHFSSLEDPFGSFLGETACGGNVTFDAFTTNAIRVNASAVAMGNMRFGKSTLLKNQMKDRSLRGDFVRVIDVTGEYSALATELGGRVLNMDGSDGIINLLEIFKAGDNENISYTRHLSKLRKSYRFLKPEAESDEVNVYIEAVEALYGRYDLIPYARDAKRQKQITGLPAKSYPRYRDLLELVNEMISEILSKTYTEQEKVLIDRKLINLARVKDQLRILVDTYGYLFDGYTSINNLMDVKVVSYNVTALKDMDSSIFDLQLFNILCISWDESITNGSIMKTLWESEKIALEDVTHTLLLVDESHRWVNAQKLFALELLGIYLREGPKYFTGLWLATQSIRDYVPDGSTKEGEKQLKTIFELAQYKFIFHQDSNVLPIIDRVFNNVLTYSQKEKIPRLQRGEVILCISGDQNIEFKVYLSEADKRLFKGGV